MPRLQRARRWSASLLATLAVLTGAGPAAALPPLPPGDPSLPRLRLVPCAPLVLVDQPCPITVLGPPRAAFERFATDPDAREGWIKQDFVPTPLVPTELDARGRADLPFGFGSTAYLYVSVPGGPPSNVVTIHVKRRVTLDVSRVSPGLYRFTGQNTPAQTPLSVTLARVLPGGRLVGLAPARLVGGGISYTVDVRLRPGTWFFTVLTGPTNRFLVQGSSRIYGLVVPG